MSSRKETKKMALSGATRSALPNQPSKYARFTTACWMMSTCFSERMQIDFGGLSLVSPDGDPSLIRSQDHS